MEKFFRKYWQQILLGLILLVAAFLRFWGIRHYLTFLYDEANHAAIIRDIYLLGKIPAVGPSAIDWPAGHIYLPPAYYYLLAPFFLVFRFHPVAGAIAVALIGLISVYYLYLLGRDWFSARAGLIASFLYATSWYVVERSRWAWNINLAPSFVIFSLYSFWQVILGRKKLFLIFALIFSLAISMHYSAILLVLPIIIAMIIWREKFRLGWKIWLGGIGLFLLPWLPFIVREFIRGYPTLIAIKNIFLSPMAGESFLTRLDDALGKFYLFFGHLVLDKQWPILSLILAILLAGFLIWKIANPAQKLKEIFPYFFIILIIATFLLQTAFFPGEIFNQYFFVLVPVIYLGLASMFNAIAGKIGHIGWLLILALTLFLAAFNFWQLPNNFRIRDEQKMQGRYGGGDDLVFAEREQMVKWIIKDASGNDFSVFYCDIPIPGFQYQNSYDYLFRLFNQNRSASANAKNQYLIFQPRTAQCDLAQVGKKISEKEFGNLKVVKTER